MSAAEWIGILGVVVLGVVVLLTRARLARATRQLHHLERRVSELEMSMKVVETEAHLAGATARRAAAAAGAEEPPPRVVFEPVTGRLLRVVAVGAGARRALHRLARPVGRRRAV
ncbi:MAG: hypothetical protein FJW86_09835 [Actinobacteria bacterium]|nr:hypothetical protein [Actinomycetota bacterium]